MRAKFWQSQQLCWSPLSRGIGQTASCISFGVFLSGFTSGRFARIMSRDPEAAPVIVSCRLLHSERSQRTTVGFGFSKRVSFGQSERRLVYLTTHRLESDRCQREHFAACSRATGRRAHSFGILFIVSSMTRAFARGYAVACRA